MLPIFTVSLIKLPCSDQPSNFWVKQAFLCAARLVKHFYSEQSTLPQDVLTPLIQVAQSNASHTIYALIFIKSLLDIFLDPSTGINPLWHAECQEHFQV
jgi:hypothetical protein